MEYRRLGRTDLMVSAICLGSMTWGQKNTEAEAFAVARGPRMKSIQPRTPLA